MKKRSNHEGKSGKNKQNESKSKKNDKNQMNDNNKNSNKNEKNDNDSVILNDDVENQGFGDWLRSSDGLEMMRLFVIANSILIFVTMGVPKIQEAITFMKEYYNGN
ncbi:putative uncharacterized protein DDB_G0275317 [Ceratina calcarata]|uniref:Uncharacterized protein n=1 Tax=Ceratina calcarata TaxID=156304 RepID=A0AAJ7JA27_9HYME|nr:putative uncharacterized protein DDB_G0275317 [Ceratina calcarata]